MAKRVAVVTGSNKGIGVGIVRGLCKQFKGDVFLTSRTEALGRETVESLKAEGLNPKYHQLDVTDKGSIEKLRDFLKENYGGLDVLVNNAGIAFKTTAPEPPSVQSEVTMKTNFFAVMEVTEILLPILRPSARVVNLSSFVVDMALPKCSKEIQQKFTSDALTKEELINLVKYYLQCTQKGDQVEKGFANFCYGMTKVAVTALTKVHQKELDGQGKQDVLVNCCDPGWVNTDMTSRQGKLTIDEGAATAIYLSLLPPNDSKNPRGAFLKDCKVREFKPEA